MPRPGWKDWLASITKAIAVTVLAFVALVLGATLIAMLARL